MAKKTEHIWVEHDGRAYTLKALAKKVGVSLGTLRRRYNNGWRGYWLTARRHDYRTMGVSKQQVEWNNRPETAPRYHCAYSGRCNSNKCDLHSITPADECRQEWLDEALGQ